LAASMFRAKSRFRIEEMGQYAQAFGFCPAPQSARRRQK
jgi:hypothetical protein